MLVPACRRGHRAEVVSYLPSCNCRPFVIVLVASNAHSNKQTTHNLLALLIPTYSVAHISLPDSLSTNYSEKGEARFDRYPLAARLAKNNHKALRAIIFQNKQLQ